MTNLIDRIETLSSQIKLLADAQVSEADAQKFATRAEEFSEPSKLMSATTQQFEMLTAKGIKMTPEFVEISDEALGLKRTIDKLMSKYSNDPRSILEPDTNWRYHTKSQLTKLVAKIREQLAIAWRNYVSELRPAVDPGLLRVLRSSPAYAVHAQNVEKMDIELSRSEEYLPTTQEQIDAPMQLAEELRRALSNLPTDIPEPVRELFTAINVGKATADYLTAEAIEWLNEKKLLQTLRITWGAF